MFYCAGGFSRYLTQLVLDHSSQAAFTGYGSDLSGVCIACTGLFRSVPPGYLPRASLEAGGRPTSTPGKRGCGFHPSRTRRAQGQHGRPTQYGRVQLLVRLHFSHRPQLTGPPLCGTLAGTLLCDLLSVALCSLQGLATYKSWGAAATAVISPMSPGLAAGKPGGT